MLTTTARGADLGDLATVLQGQRAQRHDLVVPASFISCREGRLTIQGDEPMLTEDGVQDAVYSMTDVAEEGISAKLGVPRKYLRTMREQHIDLYDENVNGWLGHESQAGQKYLFRTLRDEATGQCVARALLGNSYRPIENLDVLLAALDGIKDAGVEVQVGRCDLSDRRMFVNLHAPDVAVEAGRLLDGYRGPWHSDALAERRIITPQQAAAWKRDGDDTGHRGFYPGGQEPIILGGLELTNSDTGGGAFTLSGKLLVLRCTNGMTMDAGKVRKVHLGGKLEDGVVDWSRRTDDANLALIKSMARDAVRTFLSPDYVAAQVAALEERAGVGVEQPAEVIKNVARELSYTDQQADSILAHFIAGGQLTAGGVMHAVTSVAQTMPDADDAAGMEADAVRALDLAVAAAR